MDAPPRRSVSRAGAARDGDRAAVAAPRRCGGPSASRRAAARHRRRRGDRHRARRPKDRLRPLLRSVGRVWRVGVAALSARGLGAVAQLRGRRHRGVFLRRHRLASPPRQGDTRAQPLCASVARTRDSSPSCRQVAARAAAAARVPQPCRAPGARRAAGAADAACAQRLTVARAPGGKAAAYRAAEACRAAAASRRATTYDPQP